MISKGILVLFISLATAVAQTNLLNGQTLKELNIVLEIIRVNEWEKTTILFGDEINIEFFGDYPLEVSKIDSPFIFILYQKGKKPYVIQDILMSEDEINTYFNITNPKYYKRDK